MASPSKTPIEPQTGAHDASAIVARDLARTFRDGTEAVQGIDLTVANGEIFGFLGPNGAGKSTTVRMLTTLLSPTRGCASVGGFDVVARPREVRRLIGVALQEAGLNGMSTGRELLEMHGRLHGLGRRAARARAGELLDLVALVDAADRRALRYSGGMKRRLDLAIALMHAPSILFLDEPTTGLDPTSRRVIHDQVRTLRERDGTTVFLTTQYLDEADQLADRVAIIADGRIVSEGSPERLKRDVGADVVIITIAHGAGEGDVGGRPDEVCARAREGLAAVAGVSAVDVHGAGSGDGDRCEAVVRCGDGAALVAPLLARLADLGVGVARVRVEQPTLDDVFHAVTGAAGAVHGDDA